MTSHSGEIAGFSMNLQLSDIFPRVQQRAKWSILGAVGSNLSPAWLSWAKLPRSINPGKKILGGVILLCSGRRKMALANATLAKDTMLQGYRRVTSNLARIHSCPEIFLAASAAVEQGRAAEDRRCERGISMRQLTATHI